MRRHSAAEEGQCINKRIHSYLRGRRGKEELYARRQHADGLARRGSRARACIDQRRGTAYREREREGNTTRDMPPPLLSSLSLSWLLRIYDTWVAGAPVIHRRPRSPKIPSIPQQRPRDFSYTFQCDSR